MMREPNGSQLARGFISQPAFTNEDLLILGIPELWK
jgi:hypothetical protein